MSTTRNVAVFVGSLRKESFSRKIAKALIAMAPPALKLEIVEIGNLPLYNQDDRGQSAAAVRGIQADKCRRPTRCCSSRPNTTARVPGVLKNAIDIASRPYGHSAWSGKPGAVISNSPGAIGGFGANHALRQSLVFLNVPAMPQPEAYIGGVAKNVRRQGHPHRRDDARVPAEVSRGLRTVDRAQRREVDRHDAGSARSQRANFRITPSASSMACSPSPDLTAACTQPCRWCSSNCNARASSAA